VLTNYHVLIKQPQDDLMENARQLQLHFGKVTASDGEEAKGQSFGLSEDKPILAYSPVEQLDFVLLRVDPAIRMAEGIAPAPFTDATPARGSGLNILQHPRGETLKLAISGDGVEYINPEKGLVQYSTLAHGGSSGAPCFTDDWQVIALHHSQRIKIFGAIREGILMRPILGEIRQFL
jgi:hypothetical protein